MFVTLSFSAGHWRASKSWWKKSGLTSATRWRTGAARAWEAPTQTREVPFSFSGSTVFIRCCKYGFCSDTFSFAQILSPSKLLSVMYFCFSYCCNFPATLSSISHSLLNWLSIHTGIPFRNTQDRISYYLHIITFPTFLAISLGHSSPTTCLNADV